VSVATVRAFIDLILNKKQRTLAKLPFLLIVDFHILVLEARFLFLFIMEKKKKKAT
jgi:hypothetical protein